MQHTQKEIPTTGSSIPVNVFTHTDWGVFSWPWQLFVLGNANRPLIVTSNRREAKQSHYRPGEALRVPGVWGSQISRQSAHEGGKAVSPTHRPPLPPRKYSWYSFLLEAESTPGPQCGRKDCVNKNIPMTPSGVEPATFWLVAQCFNQLRHRWFESCWRHG